MRQHDALVRSLTLAARAAAPGVLYVDLDVDVADGIVRVVTEASLTRQQQANIRAAVAAAGTQGLPSATHWRCTIQREHSRPFTSHVLDWRGAVTQRRRSSLRAEDVAVFPLTFGEVEALARARRLLADASTHARVTATFAMGGLPLLHWVTAPAGGTVRGIEAALSRAPHFHLLPGLNWSGTHAEQDAFRAWLTGVVEAERGRVLLFDTGRDGNGVREVFRLAKEVVAAARPCGGVQVTVLGVLDGRRRLGRLAVVRGANGVRVCIRLRYRRVPHLPTEDCEVLAGYEADRARTWLHSVEGLVLVRVLDAPWLVRRLESISQRLQLPAWVRSPLQRWHRSTFVGSTGGATSIQSLVVDAHRRRQLRRGLRGLSMAHDGELGGAAILLAHAEDKELLGLGRAVEWGLIPAQAEARMAANVRARYERARERLLTVEWDRPSKTLSVL